MNRCSRTVAVVLGVIAASTVPALAWHHEGHALVARAAVSHLPDDVPAFIREGGRAIAHASLDPDQWRHALAPQLTRAEAPMHYFHYELFAGTPLPADRERFIELLAMKKLAPGDAGLLPYAIAESEQRLMMAMAEYRRWPDNELIRQKVLLYAGLLAHYTGDLAQPLHCTVHWDGRTGDDHKSPRTGIHTRIDGLLVHAKIDDLAIGDAPIEPAGDLMTAISDAMRQANDRVDRLYELEPKLPKRKGEALDTEVNAFALERGAHGVRLTASLILTAWRNSAHVNLPDYLDRAETDAE